jgi:hypothetical protein
MGLILITVLFAHDRFVSRPEPPGEAPDMATYCEKFRQSVSHPGLSLARVGYLLSVNASLEHCGDVLGYDAFEVHGVKFQYLLVRNSYILLRFDKSGRLLGVAPSPLSRLRDMESRRIAEILQGVWKCYHVSVDARAREIRLGQAGHIYVENDALCFLAGILNWADPYVIRTSKWTRTLAIDFGNQQENDEYKKTCVLPSEYYLLLTWRNIVLLAPKPDKDGVGLLLLVRERIKRPLLANR